MAHRFKPIDTAGVDNTVLYLAEHMEADLRACAEATDDGTLREHTLKEAERVRATAEEFEKPPLLRRESAGATGRPCLRGRTSRERGRRKHA
ncbi:MAG: hypothetical protein LBS92_06230 [Candidatus Methanoplasma sp.]|nr:hypothetical protein [Candidatus Methanoplasma sp.]